MLSIALGQKKLNRRYAEAIIKKNALMYLSLYPKDLHYIKMQKYLKDAYNIKADLYSICYNIIIRSHITKSDNEYSVIIHPQDEMVYKTITYGTRDIPGIPLIDKALTTIK